MLLLGLFSLAESCLALLCGWLILAGVEALREAR